MLPPLLGNTQYITEDGRSPDQWRLVINLVTTVFRSQILHQIPTGANNVLKNMAVDANNSQSNPANKYFNYKSTPTQCRKFPINRTLYHLKV